MYLTRSCFARFLFCVPFASLQRRVAQLNFLFWFIYINFYPSLLLLQFLYPHLQWNISSNLTSEASFAMMSQSSIRCRSRRSSSGWLWFSASWCRSLLWVERLGFLVNFYLSIEHLCLIWLCSFLSFVCRQKFPQSHSEKSTKCFNSIARLLLLFLHRLRRQREQQKPKTTKKPLFRRVQHVNEPLKGSDMRQQQQANPTTNKYSKEINIWVKFFEILK